MTAKDQEQRYQSPTHLLKDIVYMLRGNEEKLSFFNDGKNSPRGRKIDKLVLKKKKLPNKYILWSFTVFVVAMVCQAN